MKKKISKVIAVLLSVVMLLIQATPTMAALVEGNKYSYDTIYLDAYYETGDWYTADGHMHNNKGQVALRNLKSTGEPIYCIQIYEGCTNADATAANIKNTNLWKHELTPTAQKGMTRVSIYGYPNYNYGYNWKNAQLATEVLLWEFETGKRTDYTATATSFAKNICKNYPDALDCYLKIVKACDNHTVVPNFGTSTIELKGVGENKAVTLTDKNSILSNFNVSSSNSDVRVSKSGNSLKVWCTKAGDISAKLTLTKKNTDSNSAFALVGANQTLFYGTIADPVRRMINVKMSAGNMKLIKTSEDGKVDGVKFHIVGNNYDSTLTTDKNGVINIENLIAGTYKVTEKTSNIYVDEGTKTVVIEPGKTTTVNFSNILKKFRVKVVKSDIEKGIAQGDGTLAGASYGLYKGSTLVDTYYTDENGQFTTDYYVCDTDWYIQELSASEGYLVDGTKHPVGADPKLYTVEYNECKNAVTEQVKKGKIAIIKHTDDGSTQIETPEKDAEFQIYLKSAGSYAKADADERDTLVCDEYGYAITKKLPYGTYVVHQTKGWEGREFIKDFTVFISENEKTYPYLINNSNFESYLKVVKKDAETGKTIPYANAGFQIYDKHNNLISMTFTYPTPTTVDTFYTNDEGYLVTPEKLPYGTEYKLVEVAAPYGYIVDKTPIVFDITAENATVENALTVVKVEKKNTAQKGTISVTKSGEVFSDVSVSGNEGETQIYQPVFAKDTLKGAIYDIIAAEDIITLDGTIRAKKGDVVDTITTNDKGVAISKLLYLGKYDVKERTAPYGMVLSDEIHSVELAYAGQNVDISKTATSFYNERQKAEIKFEKSMELNELFGLGNNGEVASVSFCLYSAKELVSASGAIIPADALIEIISMDKNGKAEIKTDLPIGDYYIQEIATNDAYILNDNKYPIVFEYAGQDKAVVNLTVNDGEPIINELIYGSVKGLKIDRETGKTIEGALFGLFKSDTTEYTKDNAILTATTDENGIFTFSNLPYGSYVIKELMPAKSYLANEEIYPVEIYTNEQIIEITVVNDKIPELKTTATVNGEKEICATEVFTLVDTVEYKHLIPNKEYVLKGVLMDKNTEKELVINGETVTAETTFIPTEPSGTATVEFTFDSKYIKADTNIVVFENLYKDGKELAVHADLEDEGQTVTVKVPNIKTTAKVNGKKEIKAKGEITIKDAVSFTNLTPDKEYTIKGVLMNKATGKPFEVNGETVTSEITFIPKKSNGKVNVEFTFDAGGIKTDTELVVFETLYRDGVEIAAHADLEDEGQTIKIIRPEMKSPKTGADGTDSANNTFIAALILTFSTMFILSGIIIKKHRKHIVN